MKKITVLLSDDHTLFREGLRSLLEGTGDFVIVGEAENGHQVLRQAQRLQPDVVLMDIGMPLLNGVEATRRLSRHVPATRVLILSSYSDDHFVREAVAAGAAGFVMKETASKDLVRAIHDVFRGNAFFSPPIARRLLKQWQNREPASRSEAAPSLTSRQTEVVQLIAEGFSNKQMASLMSVSIKTVEKHRQAVMDKLDIHEVATLTRYAISSGAVESKSYAQLVGYEREELSARWERVVKDRARISSADSRSMLTHT